MERWKPAMLAALAEAAKCGDDVPVGAVLVDSEGNVVAAGRNDKELNGDPTGHAEIVAIREAAKAKGSWRLDDLTLVVTLEP
ncbi:MAG: nucleoside deaminase, partial [Rhodoluna sp.]|nr:nucleoside deaminase [Rhodoluna sp.]